jgi:hypothetical protein
VSGLKDFLTPEVYLGYKQMVYSEMEFILRNKKEYISFDSIEISEKIRKISELYDFLYLEDDKINCKKIEDLLDILRVRENISLR